jgi:hypothetical protein
VGGGLWVRDPCKSDGPAFVFINAITPETARALVLNAREATYEDILNPNKLRGQTTPRRTRTLAKNTMLASLALVKAEDKVPHLQDVDLLVTRFLRALAGCEWQPCHIDFSDPLDKLAFSLLLTIMSGTKLSFCLDGVPTVFNIPPYSLTGWEGNTRHSGAQYGVDNYRVFAKAANRESHVRLMRMMKEDELTHDCVHDQSVWDASVRPPVNNYIMQYT